MYAALRLIVRNNSGKTAVISEEINVISECFLLFKGVAPGGRSRAMRIELLLEPLIWKMLTHFGLRLPQPRRGTSFDITTLFLFVKKCLQDKIFHYPPSFFAQILISLVS